MVVEVVNKSNHNLPQYARLGDAGMDVKANIDSPIMLKPLERVIVPTGLYFAIPPGYEIQVRPRSGLAAKYGISVINSPGTIDTFYRDEIKVLLINLSNEPFVIHPDERIAQIVLHKFEVIEWNEVKELDMTNDRGGGLGHTGVK